MSIFLDPAFLLAVLLWLLVLIFALGLCVAAASGDAELERARDDEARR